MSNQDALAQLAQETIAICNEGSYLTPAGVRVDFRAALARAADGTVMHGPDGTFPDVARAPRFAATEFTTLNVSTLEAIARLQAPGRQVAALNFASARNPGGGFLRGTMAQEEALAYASGLYPCLTRVPEFYAANRANPSALYLDLIIFSPFVPFFRDDYGNLLATPRLASVITSPAPNKHAAQEHEPAALRQVDAVLRRRAEQVLAVARVHGVDVLILGAWGCGVFGNDPRTVARIFAALLGQGGAYAGAFEQVVFAVLDRHPGAPTYQVFADLFGVTA